MSRFRGTFKRSALDPNDRRQDRVSSFAKNRKEKRGVSFAAQRKVDVQEEEDNDDNINFNVADCNHDAKTVDLRNEEGKKKTSKDNVKLRLQKWKAEKEKQKLKELHMKSKSRQPFKTGVVHHTNKPLEVVALHPIKNVFAITAKSTIPFSVTKKTTFQSSGKVEAEGTSFLQQEAYKLVKEPTTSAVKTFNAKTQNTQTIRYPTSVKNEQAFQFGSTVQTRKQIQSSSSDNVRVENIKTIGAKISTHSRVTRANLKTILHTPGPKGDIQATQTPGAKVNVQPTIQTPGTKTLVQPTTQTPGTRRIVQLSTQTPGTNRIVQPTIQTPGTRRIVQPTTQTPGTRRIVQPTTQTPGTNRIVQPTIQTPGTRRIVQPITQTPGTKRIVQPTTQTPGTKRIVQPTTQTPGTRKIVQPTTQTPGTKRTVEPTTQTPGLEKNQQQNSRHSRIPALKRNVHSTTPTPTVDNKVAQKNKKSQASETTDEIQSLNNSSSQKHEVMEKVIKPRRLRSQAHIIPETLPEPNRSIGDSAEVAPTEEIHDCNYFRAILAKTIALLEQRCDVWEHEQQTCADAMTEIAHEQLLLATGMARLLIREKFAQFRGLIETCEDPSAVTKTLCSDLQGFWDMIYIQVGDIDKKFKELEVMKKNNWVPVNLKAAPKIVKKKVVAAKPKPAAPRGPSKFRAFIAAARKNKDLSDDPPETIQETNNASILKDTGSKVPTAPQRCVPRSSISTPMKKIESPNVSAIWSASRSAKTAGKKSFPLDDSMNTSLNTTHCLTPSLQKAGSSKHTKYMSEASPTPIRSILKREEAMSGVAKKNVLFNATIEEEKEEDEEAHVMPVSRTYSHHHYTVSPVKDRFDALFVSSPIAPRKPSLLYTPPNSEINELPTEDNETPITNKALFDIPEEPTTKVYKAPTPHVTKRKERKTHPYENTGGPMADATNLISLNTPVLPGRTTRTSKILSQELSSSSKSTVTPDLITWDSPYEGDTPKRRKSSRLSKK